MYQNQKEIFKKYHTNKVSIVQNKSELIENNIKTPKYEILTE